MVANFLFFSATLRLSACLDNRDSWLQAMKSMVHNDGVAGVPEVVVAIELERIDGDDEAGYCLTTIA